MSQPLTYTVELTRDEIDIILDRINHIGIEQTLLTALGIEAP